MEQYVNAIQAVMNTLQKLEITSTYENMNNMLASLQMLAKVRDELKNIVLPTEDQPKPEEIQNDRTKRESGK